MAADGRDGRTSGEARASIEGLVTEVPLAPPSIRDTARRTRPALGTSSGTPIMGDAAAGEVVRGLREWVLGMAEPAGPVVSGGTGTESNPSLAVVSVVGRAACSPKLR